MKSKIKRHSRSALAVILTLSMLVSCMMVGLIATDAAKVTDSGAVGAQADSEEVGLDQGDGIHLGIGTTTKDWHGMGSSAYEFTLSATTTIYWTFSCGGGNFGKGNQSTPGEDSEESWTWYAVKGSSTEYSKSLPAGTYKFQLLGINPNDSNSLMYKFWCTSGGSSGGSTSWHMRGGGYDWNSKEAGSEFTYNSETGYYEKTVSWKDVQYFKVCDGINQYSGNNSSTDDYVITTGASFTTLVSNGTKSFKFSAESTSTEYIIQIWEDSETNKIRINKKVAPIAASLTLEADKTTLTSTSDTVTFIATANSPLQNNDLTYRLYESGSATELESKTTTSGGSVTFTARTSQARAKTYYATVEYTTTPASYGIVQSNDVTISNTADEYIPRYAVTFSSNNNSYGTVTAKLADGTALSSGNTVKEGTSVTFTAEPTAGNVFVEWDGFDNTTATVTRIIRAATTVQGKFGPKGYKVLAGSDSTNNMRELPNGTYISTVTYGAKAWFELVRNSTGSRTVASENTQGVTKGTKYKVTSWESGTTWRNSDVFKVYDTESAARYVVYDPSTDQVWLTDDSDDLYGVTVVAKDGSIRYGYNATYSSDYGDTTMSAKLGDGTEFSSHDAYDSKAKSIDFTADQVRKGITLHVTTQVKDAYVSQGYYVKGFVVTGYEESFSVLWQDEPQDQSWINSGYNEFDLTLPEYPAKNVEITPVYWIKETNPGDNVRFYVDGFAGEVYDEWDGNLAIEAYQTNGTPVLGEYPGQPMINYNGRYVVDLPRTSLGGITLNNYVWDRVHSNMFYGTSGIDTPNTTNQYLNKIQAANKQTYDFNDFIYIKQGLETDADQDNNDEDIIFSFRYKYDENHKTLETSNHGKMTYYKDSDAAGKDPVVTVDTNYDYEDQASTLDVNNNIYQWENLTDFYDNRVDILGNYVDTKDQNGTATNPKAACTNPVRIVSNGYDFSEAGKYATAWAIYVPVDSSDNLAPTGAYHHYKLVEVFGGQGKVKKEENKWVGKWGSSSYLVNPTWTNALKDKYDQAYHDNPSITHTDSSFIYDLAKMPTVISYEYSIFSNKSNLNLEGAGNATTDGNPGLRSDGRWYASNSNQLLKAHTIIEYAEKDDDSAYTRDYYQSGGVDYTSSSGYVPSANTGLATGIQAYFENSNSDILDNVSFQNTSGDTEAYSISDGEDEHRFLLKTVADPNGDYTFKGWYLYSNGKYSLVSRSETYASEATANDVYVARYYKTPSGSLNVSHLLTSDSRGDATCSAQIKVLNGSTPVYTYAYTTDTIKVTPTYIKSGSSYNLEITLKTKLGANTLFDKFKEKITSTDLGDLIEGNGKLGITATVAIDTSSTDKTATITFPISALFTGSGAEATQTVKALQFFSKTTLPAYQYEITYNFGTRKLIQNGKLSNNRLWGDQFYKYKGTFTDEQVDQYLDLSGTPTFKSAETANYLAEHSPYEKNFLEDTVWDFNNQTITYNEGTLTFTCSLTATQTTNTDINVTFNLPFDYSLDTSTANAYTFSVTKQNETDNPVYKDYKNVEQHASVTMDFLDWFSLNGVKNKTQMTDENQPEFLKVPDVLYNDATNATKKRTFKYWAFFKDGDDIDTAEPYQKCYSSALNQAVYQDTIFYPVYTEELDMSADEIREVAAGKSATITFLGVTRDQWNYNGGGTQNVWDSKFADRIFTDFVLSFTYENKLIPTNNASFRTGLIIQTLDTPAGGIENATPETLAAAASNNGKDEAIAKIKNTNSDISESGVGNYLISYNQQALDDRNAIEYYYGIANVSQSTNPTNDTYTSETTRRNFGYRAYSFIKKGTGSSAEVIISDPVYFTIYDVASIANGSEQVASGS